MSFRKKWTDEKVTFLNLYFDWFSYFNRIFIQKVPYYKNVCVYKYFNNIIYSKSVGEKTLFKNNVAKRDIILMQYIYINAI